MSFKNILFDLDGTITNSVEGITNSIFHSLKYYPHITPPKREELLPFIGPPLTVSYAKYFGMDEKTAKEAVEHYREYYRETGILELSLYEGIAELIRELSEKGYKVILATSKPEHFAIKILQHFELAKYFSVIAGATMDEKRTEKNEVIRYAISKGDICDLSGTVMIGDREYDVLGAKEIGMDSIGVLYGYGSRTELEKAGATYIAENVSDILNFI